MLMTERSLQASIIELCKLFGLKWYHTYDSRRSNMGWPDLVIYGSGILYRELKDATRKLTAHQVQCGDDLRRAGQDWAVWRPLDLQSGRIENELRAIR